MPIFPTFPRRRIKRTRKVDEEKVLLIYDNGPGQTGDQEVVSLDDYRKERTGEFIPPAGDGGKRPLA